MDRAIADFEMLARYTKALAVALGYRDLYTRLHSDRVSNLAWLVGKAIGLDDRDLGILRIAASFHDIGKLGIPDAILAKAGTLDLSEREIVERHPVFGEQIMLATEIPGCKTVAAIVRHHHECYGGRGYPDGLVGEAIPLASRIIGIVDSYDAMAVHRPYQRALAHREIIGVLETERGAKHDPRLLDVFLSFIEDSEFRAT